MNREQTLRQTELLSFERPYAPSKSDSLEEELVELYASMRPPLLGYAYQIVRSTGESEDLVQMTFLKMFDQLQRKLPIQNVRSWLYRVLHNLAVDHIRRRQIHEGAVGDWVSAQERSQYRQSTEEAMIVRQRIENSLQCLNDRERHCLLLRAEGLRYQEIGEVLGISAKAVSVYLARGLKKFEVKNAAEA
jgi:RNA polymerase sigma-70 factor (ECF subfamily)